MSIFRPSYRIEEYRGKKYITGSTQASFPNYENRIVDQLNSYSDFPPYHTKFKTKEDFQDFIKAALGWNNLQPISDDNATPIVKDEQWKAYSCGNISENEIIYSHPPISVQFLYARQDKDTTDRSVVIVLHGHHSSAFKVMGLDNPDFMQTVGKTLFNKGFDVIAFNTTSNMELSGYLNGQLSLYGIQIYGLWARAVTDLIRILEFKNKYRNIYLYGFSNGGLISQFISVLNEDFDKIINGDILLSWRQSAKKHPSLHKQQNYGIFFLRPLWFKSSYKDIIRYSSPSTYFTRSEKYIRLLIDDEFEVNHGIDHSSVNFVFKELPFHIPEIETIMKILTENSSLDGLNLPIS